ncbi:MAG: ABC transporter permease [Oligoflexia bacterium]|nr:ABC transporter permease [Oligoflexia bacterium]MBF0365794.1 ABC transporter permease [Oligoflexia bacterium]
MTMTNNPNYNVTLYLSKLALKNILRNPLRSCFLSFSIALAVVLAVWIVSIFAGINKQIASAVRDCNIGHIQLLNPDFDQTRESDKITPLDPSALKALATLPFVRAISPEMLLEGQVSAPAGTRPIEIIGIDPPLHSGYLHLEKHLHEQGGNYLGTIDEGVLIGESLAKYYSLTIGDTLVFHYQNSVGELTSTLLTIQGIFKLNGPAFEMKTVYANYPYVQQLFFTHTPPLTGFNRIVLSFDAAIEDHDLTAIPKFDQALSELQAQFNLSFVRKSWHQINPEMAVVIKFHEGIIYFFLVVVAITIFITILTPVSMLWHERTHELRMLNIIGISKNRIYLLSLLEGIELTALSLLLATILLLFILGIQSYTGIDVEFLTAGKSITRAGISLSEKIYPLVSTANAVAMASLVTLVVLLSYARAVASATKSLWKESLPIAKGKQIS